MRSLESRGCAGVSTGQHRAHAPLAVYLSRGAPVHLIRADHTASSTGQFVADAAALIGVIAHLQNHTRLQHKHRHSGSCAAGHGSLVDVAGVDDLWSILGRLWLTRGDTDSAYR